MSALGGAVLVAACGGAATDPSATATNAAIAAASSARQRALAITPSAWVTIPAKADPLLQGLGTIPADAPTKGLWSAVQSWPLNGLHAVLLPNGRLMTWGTSPDGNAQNGQYMDVWDPTLGFTAAAHQMNYRPDLADSFCGASAYLSDGRLVMAGGNSNLANGSWQGVKGRLYSPGVGSTAALDFVLSNPRWYATMITMADGRPLMLGGMVPYSEGMEANPDLAVTQGLASMTPEVLGSTGWRSLLGATSRDAFGPDFLRASYPRAWVAPSGRVFGLSAETMWSLDPNGDGSVTVLGKFKTAPDNTTRPNVGATNSAVMFAPGKVLVVGGNGSFNTDGRPASAQATVIDFNGATPVLAEQPAMSHPRRMHNATVLPDGRVVVNGGSRVSNNNGADAVYPAELWNPATGTWTVGASAAIYRGYHSFSTLLPNGTVLSTGGGTPGPVTNLNAEVYVPPPLFRSVNGVAQLAPRPVMQAISGRAYAHAAPLQVDMASSASIGQLVLMGVTNGTHAFNAGQRRIPLAFTQQDFRLTATLPDANLAPPGYYQLVAIDAAGVPSVGTIIAVGNGLPAPTDTSASYTPPDLTQVLQAPLISAGGTASYTMTATAGTTYSWNFGDGSTATAFSANPNTSHVFTAPGVYSVLLTMRAADGTQSVRALIQGVSAGRTAKAAVASSPIAVETRTQAATRVWSVNPDNDSVTVIDAALNTRLTEIAVGRQPRSVAVAPDGRLWVTNKGAATVSVLSPSTLAVVQTIALPRASQPHGLVFTPGGASAWVVLEATGQLLKLDAATGAVQGQVAVGANARHVSMSGDGATLLVSRFITPPLAGEGTATVNTAKGGGEVLAINAATLAVTKTVTLQHSDKPDGAQQGSGVPNYLGAAVIAPDGQSAWVPSKQDNIKRGTLRNGLNLDFQNTVRAITSRIDLATLTETPARRIDHDNSSVGAAAAFHPSGVYLFVALETSRHVAVIDAASSTELFRLTVGRAPQGVAVSPDGTRLFVQNFMDRSVSLYDLTPMGTLGELRAPFVATLGTVTTEKLPAQVLSGKQFFYDARDTRLARDGYMSCAACHNDGGHDGRTWDLSGLGEGLRNTISLKGRAATGHGILHWSANFDELQDFEGQIRTLAGGTGLMSDAAFNTGTRNQPLGDKKAGVSADLDALAAYVASLNSFDASPARNADGSFTAAALAGRAVFDKANCATCHAGADFTNSRDASTLRNIGTLKASSGQRLGAALTGIDVPTLRDVWATAPYLHDGSAPTLAAAVQAHAGNTVAGTDLSNLVAWLQQVGERDAGLAGAWSFSEGGGFTAADQSGLGRTLTLSNTAWVSGPVGVATRYNGSTAAGSTAAAVLDTTGSFTVSTWVRLDSLSGWQTLLSQDGANASGFWLLYSEDLGRKFALTMHDADTLTSTPFRAVGTSSPITGAWTHVTGVRDKASGTLKLYINGKLEATTAFTGAWAAGGTFNVGRGKFGVPDDYLAGSLDEVRVYNLALSDADVAQLFQQNGGSALASNKPPTVLIKSPASGAALLPGPVTVSAGPGDTDGWITRAEFYDNGSLIGTATQGPWTVPWTATVGSHKLTVRAFDNLGANTLSAVVPLTVRAGTANAAPSVALVAPISGTTRVAGTAMTLSASASDADGTVARVDFYDGSTLIGSRLAAPWSLSWTGTAGAHSLTARAIDNSGASSTSAAVTITLAAGNTAPTVQLASPTATTAIKAGVAITLSARPGDKDGYIRRVEFRDGATLVGTAIASPWSVSWSGTAGNHSLSATAVDNNGASTTSTPVLVTITP